MRAISRRVGKLEDKFGVAETEFTCDLAARIEAGRRRAGYPEGSREDLSALTVEQILNRGRLQALRDKWPTGAQAV